MSYVASQQIRNDGDFFKYLKLEQEIERAHHILNILERRFEAVKNKAVKGRSQKQAEGGYPFLHSLRRHMGTPPPQHFR